MKTIVFFILMIPLMFSAQIFTETFESGVFPPAGWTINQTSPNQTWTNYDDAVDVGNHGAQVQYDLVDQDEDLISPVIDLSAITEAVLTFDTTSSYYWGVNPNDNYDIRVSISVDGGTTWAQLWSEDDLAADEGGSFVDWQKYTVVENIDAYTGNANVKLKFNYTGNDGAQWWIDNITIQVPPESAPDCASLVAPADGATDIDFNSDVILTWEAPTTGNQEISGYKVYLDTVDGSTLLGQTTDLTYTFTNVESSNTYYWKVVPFNLAGEAMACTAYSFTTSSSVFSPYCGPIEFNYYVEPITLVQFAGIDNSSSADVPSGIAHEDFISIEGSVSPGSSYPITLKGNTNGNWADYFSVFIDWNQNGVLDDEGEIYFDDASVSIINSTGEDNIMATGSIAVPTDALLGTTRMRVRKKWQPGNLADPCSDQDYGQVEDYTINVTTMGVEDINANSNTSLLYPNPVKEIFTIRLSEAFDATQTSVQITDMNGKQVMSTPYTAQINVSSLPKGVYLVTLLDGNHTETQKLIKE